MRKEVLGLLACLALSACTGGSTNEPEPVPTATAPPASAGQDVAWDSIFAGPDARTLFIDFPQTTSDKSDPCYQGVRPAVRSISMTTISIALLSKNAGQASPPGGCSLELVPQLALVEVTLPLPFTGQRIIDASTGIVRELRSLAELREAQRRSNELRGG